MMHPETPLNLYRYQSIGTRMVHKLSCLLIHVVSLILSILNRNTYLWIGEPDFLVYFSKLTE